MQPRKHFFKEFHRLKNNYNLSFGSLKKWTTRGSSTEYWNNKLNEARFRVMRIEKRRERNARITHRIGVRIKGRVRTRRPRYTRRLLNPRGRVSAARGHEMNVLNQQFQINLNRNNPRTVTTYHSLTVQEILTTINIRAREMVLIEVGGIGFQMKDNAQKQLLIEQMQNVLIHSRRPSTWDEIMQDLMVNPNATIRIKRMIRTKHPHWSGDFFKYVHLLPQMDLQYLDIYSDISKGDHSFGCLYIAFRTLGMSTSKLQKFASLSHRSFDNKYIPLKSLRTIAKILQIKIRVRQVYTSNKKTRSFGNSEEIYSIVLYEDHYFANVQTEYTTYSIKNYFKVKDEPNWNSIVKKRANGNYQRDFKGRYINSRKLVEILLEHKETHLRPLTTEELMFAAYFDPVKHKITNLEYTDEDTRLAEYKDRHTTHNYYTCYFDFEAETKSEKNQPYLVCCAFRDLEYKKSFRKPVDFLKYLSTLVQWELHDSRDFHILCIAHNLRYDIQFLLKYLNNVRSMINPGAKVYTVTGDFFSYELQRKITIKFKDCWAVIHMPLRDFAESFNLKSAKEVMPYDIYDQNSIARGKYKISKAIAYLEKEEDKPQFLQNIVRWGCKLKGGYFDLIKYSKKYCHMDVEVMKKGYEKFRKWMLEITQKDIDHLLTITSLVFQQALKEGVFSDVVELSGVPREFIQSAVVGGRVMCRENKKFHTKVKIQDFDAVSCYPSAMARMKGCLKGKPKIIPEDKLKYEELQKFDGYFVEIEIIKVNKHRSFPLISYKRDDCRRFVNETGTMYVDKTTLEDLIEFQKIEFKIIRGYYFDEGRHPQINEFINVLFEERKKKKKEGNPIQSAYKTLMNSFYGRTIMNAINYRCTFKYGEDSLYEFLQMNERHWKYYVNITDTMFMVKMNKSIVEHFSMPHVGVEILSMAKRIMNEVMCLAEDIGAQIWYTDTDSMHITEADIPKLAKAYKEKYGKELIGRDLGQFHCDFSFDHDKENEVLPVAVESYFLAKKTYIDKVECIRDGEKCYEYHIRMKGIPEKCILQHESNKHPMEIYKDLFEGKTYTFDLCKGIRFKSHVDFSMSTVLKFTRTIHIV